MSTGDQELGLKDVLLGSEIICEMTQAAERCAQDPETNVIRGLFDRRARTGAKPFGPCDPKSSGPLSPPTVTCHTLLSCLDTGPGLNLVDSTWPAGTLVPSHIHHGADEVLIVLSGTVEVRMGGQAFRFGPGQTAFIPRGMEHEVRAFTETRHIAILTRRSLDPARAA